VSKEENENTKFCWNQVKF